jgi:hypothetical protein
LTFYFRRKERLMRIAVLLVAVALLQGCTINQNVSGVVDKGITEITIIENPAVRNTFLDALNAAVRKQGVETQIGPRSSPPANYPYAMTYTANWSWDMALYLVYTEINIYHQGEKIGGAVYDAKGGSANLGKFINAEEKVNELVDELFKGKKPD